MSDRWSPTGTLLIAVVVYLVSIYGFFVHFDFYTPKDRASLELTLMGAGMGLFFAPVTLMALRGLEHKTILVISLLDYIRFIGGSFGTALATNVLKGNSSMHYDEMSSLQGLNTNLINQKLEKLSQFFLGTSTSVEEALIRAYYSIAQVKAKLALSYAFQDLFVWCGIFSLVGILPILLLLCRNRGCIPTPDNAI
jgi:DHA2 family multidrug resistance protein